MENTFTHKKACVNGVEYDMLIANEYPWLNLQVIIFAASEHDEAIAKLKSQRNIGWVVEHPGRRDFAIIHAGGSGKLEFTQENHKRIVEDMKQCLVNGARCWAENEYITE